MLASHRHVVDAWHVGGGAEPSRVLSFFEGSVLYRRRRTAARCVRWLNLHHLPVSYHLPSRKQIDFVPRSTEAIHQIERRLGVGSGSVALTVMERCDDGGAADFLCFDFFALQEHLHLVSDISGCTQAFCHQRIFSSGVL